MYDKGFTLMEMLIVLSIISMCLFIFPILSFHRSIQFTYRMQEIKQKILLVQAEALCQKKQKDVAFLGNQLVIDGEVFHFKNDMYCDIASFHYTKEGNISHAGTISCYQDDMVKHIVLQLGSGQIDIR